MSDFDIKFGPWINYGIGNKTDDVKGKMTDLVQEIWSPFNGQDRAKVFIFCMAYGFAKGIEPEKPPSSGSGSMPASAFDKEMRNYMKIVAISAKEDFSIATDANEVVKICEGYAYAAFLTIYEKIKNRDLSIKPEAVLEKLIKETSK